MKQGVGDRKHHMGMSGLHREVKEESRGIMVIQLMI